MWEHIQTKHPTPNANELYAWLQIPKENILEE
jgi:hypothetical protein